MYPHPQTVSLDKDKMHVFGIAQIAHPDGYHSLLVRGAAPDDIHQTSFECPPLFTTANNGTSSTGYHTRHF